MSEMVERLAKAIFMSHNGLRKHARGLTWEDNAVDWEKDEYRAMVRAALEELREPTADMIDAGRDIGHDAPYGLSETIKRWQAMIDEALK